MVSNLDSVWGEQNAIKFIVVHHLLPLFFWCIFVVVRHNTHLLDSHFTKENFMFWCICEFCSTVMNAACVNCLFVQTRDNMDKMPLASRSPCFGSNLVIFLAADFLVLESDCPPTNIHWKQLTDLETSLLTRKHKCQNTASSRC